MKIRKPPVSDAPAPFYDPAVHGVTFSLLDKFLTCRELAKNALEGWSSTRVSNAILFGNLTHAFLERLYKQRQAKKVKGLPSVAQIARILDGIEQLWRDENPQASADTLEALELAMTMLHVLMPLYVQHWAADFTDVQWEALEEQWVVPNVPVPVPVRSGSKALVHPVRYVAVRRGKMDGVFRRGEKRRLRLFETKTKSQFDDDFIGKVLPMELQVNVYLAALKSTYKEAPSGVLYNVIRRPQLRKKDTESLVQFGERIRVDVLARPKWYFARLDMSLVAGEMAKAEAYTAAVVTDFLMWWHGHSPHYPNTRNCDNKYGKCPFLDKCASGSTVGLYKRDRVFPELEEL